MESKNRVLSEFERTQEPPKCIRTHHSIDIAEFERKVRGYDEELSRNLYAGDAFIIRNVVSPSILERMKRETIAWGKRTAEEYQPMLVGSRDYHQSITPGSEAHQLIKIKPVRHSYFFFRWNDDPVGTFKHGNHIWGLIKMLGGFDYDSFTKDFSNDHPIDRAQMAHYPPGEGLLAKHNDPYHNQKAILGVYLSKHGEDFDEGGIYFMDKDNKEVFLEDRIERGDALIAYPTITHGVATVDPHKDADWETDRGRWFLGLYTNDSNAKTERKTSSLAEAK